MAPRGRPRIYATHAEKIQAYRQRQKVLQTAPPHVRYLQISPHCAVYCGDWHDVAVLLPRQAAIVTDPPYAAQYDVTKTRRRSHWDRNFVGADQPFDPTPWLRFPEVILFGATHYWDSRLVGGSWCVWHKIPPEQRPADFAPYEDIWLWKPGPLQHYSQLWRGGMREGEENYVHLPKKLHPAQKPIDLLTFLVEQTTAPVVIDPFMGSGTTLAACVRLGRPCIGIELDPAYFAVACERLQHEVEARAQQRHAEAAD